MLFWVVLPIKILKLNLWNVRNSVQVEVDYNICYWMFHSYKSWQRSIVKLFQVILPWFDLSLFSDSFNLQIIYLLTSEKLCILAQNFLFKNLVHQLFIFHEKNTRKWQILRSNKFVNRWTIYTINSNVNAHHVVCEPFNFLDPCQVPWLIPFIFTSNLPHFYPCVHYPYTFELPNHCRILKFARVVSVGLSYWRRRSSFAFLENSRSSSLGNSMMPGVIPLSE